MVAEITDLEGNVSYEVLDTEVLSEKDKELKEAYKEASKRYESLEGDGKAQAKKPVRPVVKKMRTTNDQTNAKKIAQELQEKRAAKQK